MNEKQNNVMWSLVLGKGEAAAVSGETLAKRCGFTNTRELRSAVSDARLQGVPIMSTVNGYFLGDPEKPEEAEHTVNILKMRAYTSLKLAAVLNRWLKDQTGHEPTFEQMTVGDFLKECEQG